MALASCRSSGRENRAVQARRLCARFAGVCAALLTLVPSGPALALSCAPWSHLDAWAEAAASDELYLVARGTLVFDERALPQTDWDDQTATPALTRIEAFFRGDQLGRNGFQRPYEAEVVLEVACFGPWCARVPTGAEIIAFLEIREGEVVLATNPCGGFALPASSGAERDLKRCMRGTCP